MFAFTLISEINSKNLKCTHSKIVETVLFDDTLFIQFDSNRVLNAAITFTVSSERGTLFYCDYGERKWATDHMHHEFWSPILFYISIYSKS